ncbi:MAG: DegT/DnrJ/EryC1/StrS family aminotransferase [Deltaproteobacteria bacterium]|nr:DegT/DnrJ/EryC1/StrS family aminotransferase [Deltaproteobacteria bacterium]
MHIPLIKPFITDDIKAAVIEVLESGYLTEGPVTHELEENIKNYIGCKHVIAFSSCTTGLETALRCLGIGPGDEVIVPDYTYPATATVAPLIGAKSIIVDIDRDSMLIDYDAIEKAITPDTKAIIPVSLFGNPLDYSRLMAIKEKYGLFIIEDAACSIGAEYRDEKVGNIPDMGVFSLHPRKFITTGEGGILTTNNNEWAVWISSFKHFGMGRSVSREGTEFNIVGTNYKLSNVLAAIGKGQMDVIDELLQRRRELAKRYTELLENIPEVVIPATTHEGVHSYQSFTVFIENRDRVMKKMRDRGIEVQIGTYSLHMHKAFQDSGLVKLSGEYANSRWVYDHCLALPLYHELGYREQEEVVGMLKDLL